MAIEQPNFIERDFEATRNRMISDSGIQPADPEYVLLTQIAYDIYILRCNIQDADKQNLLDFARYPMLDYLGALRNCVRYEGESDDEYRVRIRESMNAFTVCGTEAAYRYISKNADPENIIDVDPYSALRSDGTPAGIVQVFVLTKNYWTTADYAEATGDDKAAMDEVLAKVAAALTPVDVRPLGEKVEVYFPDKKEIAFTVSIIAKRSASNTLQSDIQEALNAYLANVKSHVSKDVVISQVIGICQSFDGCYKAVCSLSADEEAAYNEFIEAVATVTITGVTDERE
ncbi:baseplate J/gp47 family protein [bacterium]|nr:baseplate J/gp47 family protein [bacterium]